jgi:hypothetical protein
VTLHLTLTWLWVVLGIVWFVGVVIGLNVSFSIGEWPWWQRVLIIVWPLTAVALALRALLWWG